MLFTMGRVSPKIHYMHKQYIIIIFLVAVVVGISMLWAQTHRSASQSETASVITLNPTTEKIFNVLPSWLPRANWSNPKASIQSTMYGDINGVVRSATIITKSVSTTHFEQQAYIQQLGFSADDNLSADGPGSSTWGYKKESGDQTQIILLSSQTMPSKTPPNRPLQFNCPCTTKVSVFVSESFTPKK